MLCSLAGVSRLFRFYPTFPQLPTTLSGVRTLYLCNIVGSCSVWMLLLSLDDDILIHILSFLLPVDILQVRKTNKRLFSLSNLRIVWTNVCNTHILRNGYPFPSQPRLELMTDAQLEQHTLHASSLASRWRSDSIRVPYRDLFIDATSSTSVFQVRFVPGHAGDWILTASKTIWDVLILWAITFKVGEEDANNGTFEKVCDWSPRGGIFNGFCLNTDISSSATLAISVLKDDEYTIEILSIGQDASGDYGFQRTRPPVVSNLKPVKLHGDLLIISDNIQRSELLNLRTGEKAVLEDLSDQDHEDVPWKKVPKPMHRCCSDGGQHSHRKGTLDMSISIPAAGGGGLKCAYSHRSSFLGWIDGVSVTVDQRTRDISLLLRAESDDPWASGSHTLDLYKLYRADPPTTYDSTSVSHPDPSFDAEMVPPTLYHFPPVLQSQVPAIRGALRCRTVVLGSSGSAVWIQPQDRTFAGLVDSYPIFLTNDPGEITSRASIQSKVQHCEAIAISVFPGPLADEEIEPCGNKATTSITGTKMLSTSRAIYTNQFNNWTALDYDEVMGRIAVASSFGNVTVLEL